MFYWLRAIWVRDGRRRSIDISNPVCASSPIGDHRVIATGPYAYVRHPGYAFAIVLTFGIALASLWALLPALLVVVVLLIRTILEDAFLHRELSGYTDFASRTRYKWIPGIW